MNRIHQNGPNQPVERVRIGIVGVGGMGTVHIQNLVQVPGAEITAVCDIAEEHANKARDMITDAGHPAPTLYTRGERDFERLCGEEDLDIVYTATPWEWHTPVCVEAMRQGKHAASEVPAAVTLEECWQLVETAEKNQRHCAILENCCYDQVELMILNMVRKGVFGDLLYAECGYLHDLRENKFRKDGGVRWRIEHSIRRNEDLYPTHGVGPVAQCMNINRGNRFARLVSMGTLSNGLSLYAAKEFGPDSPQAKQTYALGDVVTTLIQTAAGQTIVVKHDTDSPRPYSRDICLQGTRGIVRKYPEEKIHVEGRTEGHDWEPLSNYQAEFEHPLFKSQGDKSTDVGHGSMDYIVDSRLIQCLRTGTAPDIDVYDAAAWSAISALSGRSIAGGNQPVEFPDFTRGQWKERPPLGIVG
jgi:predicted dehydrogenase